MHGHDIVRALVRLARRQHGAFTRQQAIQVGYSPKMIQNALASGAWFRLQPGVFTVAWAPPTWHTLLAAALLAAGPAAAISHRAAAALWRLDEFEPGCIEITVPRNSCPRLRGVVLHRSGDLTPRDITAVGSLAVTTPARTLIDLGAVVRPHMVESALHCAKRLGLVSTQQVWARLNALARRGRRGVGVTRGILLAQDPSLQPAMSVLESRTARLLRRHGVIGFQRQYRIESAGRVAFIDLADARCRVGIECQGYRWHSGRQQWRSDMERLTWLAGLGWRILLPTWDDIVHRPEWFVRQVRDARRFVSA